MSLAKQSAFVALAVAVGVCCSWSAAADAAPGAPPGYPASAEQRDVLAWLSANTSVRPGDIVVVSPQAVVSLDGVARGADKTAPIDVIVREELIDAGLAERTHARSTRVQVQLDCAASMFRIRESTRFALPDLKGDAVNKPSSASWTRLEDGTAMVKVAHAACVNGDVQMASASAPAPKAAPAVIKAAPPPAPAALAPAVAPRPGSTEPSFWILLGSYSNKDNAHVAVTRLTRGFPGPIKGRDVVVHKTSVKGRDVFFVAVEGFPQRADASGFCKAVHAAPDDCLIHH